MRDQHRPKQELCDELAGLRKQVADLKAEMVARRRVEDALRHSEEQLRALADSAPAGLCIVRRGGALRVANLPFARLLGYESPAELQRLSETFGLFAGQEDLGRVLALADRSDHRMTGASFRRKDGTSQSLGVIGASCTEGVAIAVLAWQAETKGATSPLPGVRTG
jgi:PAS domain S-box-containing protein